LKVVDGVHHAGKDFHGLKRCWHRLKRVRVKMEYIDLLKFNAKYFGPGNTFCAHAPGAAEAFTERT